MATGERQNQLVFDADDLPAGRLPVVGGGQDPDGDGLSEVSFLRDDFLPPGDGSGPAAFRSGDPGGRVGTSTTSGVDVGRGTSPEGTGSQTGGSGGADASGVEPDERQPSEVVGRDHQPVERYRVGWVVELEKRLIHGWDGEVYESAGRVREDWSNWLDKRRAARMVMYAMRCPGRAELLRIWVEMECSGGKEIVCEIDFGKHGVVRAGTGVWIARREDSPVRIIVESGVSKAIVIPMED